MVEGNSGTKGFDYIVMIINKILGEEWSMSNVQILPPHDLDKPHALVARK